MSEISEQNKQKILEIYYDPSKGFTSAQDIYKKLKMKIKLKDIKEILSNTELKQIYKPKDDQNMIPFSANPYTFQIDLTFYEQYKKANSGYIGLLTIIEITSRYLFCYPIKNKTSNHILEHMKFFINEDNKNKVKCIESDAGNEFMKVQKYCLNNNIMYIMIHKDDSKNAMAIVERVNRTIRDKIEKYIESYNTYKYIDVLPQLVENYNNTEHRTLNTTPNHAFNNIEKYHDPLPKTQKIDEIENEFNENDKVRLLRNKKTWEKGSKNYTKTLYKIREKDYNGYIVEEEKTKKCRRVLPVQMQKVENVIENPNMKRTEKEKVVEKYEKEKQHKRKIKKECLDVNLEKEKKLVRLKKQLE
jgi:hypothetical protein